MRKKQLGLLGVLIGAGLLFVGAGLTLAQEPSPSPAWPAPGGMMGGGQGMMGGGQGMMGGGQGMMGAISPEEMAERHEQMVAGGLCDQAQMQEMHAQHHP
jgi:hypothetical protein